jgi:chemotaxis protein methyltransferase WspC
VESSRAIAPDAAEAGERLVPAADTLDAIRRTGDKGDLQEAVRACSEYLRRVPDSADGHFLLGVLQGALGLRDAAESALRRAVYLAPNHADALVHLALMHDARGDAAGAARLRARGARAQPVSEGDA